MFVPIRLVIIITPPLEIKKTRLVHFSNGTFWEMVDCFILCSREKTTGGILSYARLLYYSLTILSKKGPLLLFSLDSSPILSGPALSSWRVIHSASPIFPAKKHKTPIARRVCTHVAAERERESGHCVGDVADESNI